MCALPGGIVPSNEMQSLVLFTAFHEEIHKMECSAVQRATAKASEESEDMKDSE
jgi:hypothetical protein